MNAPHETCIGRQLLCGLLSCLTTCVFGCSTETEVDEPTLHTAPAPESPSDSHSDDLAVYEYHRGVEFADATRELPEGSVDHVDFDGTANPNVIVIVTVHAEPVDGLRFTTTFTGADNLSIEKEWQPAGLSDDTDYVGVFVLPAAVDDASTIVH